MDIFVFRMEQWSKKAYEYIIGQPHKLNVKAI